MGPVMPFLDMLGELSTLIVLIGGVVVAAIRWQYAPKASALAMAGLGLMLFSRLSSDMPLLLYYSGSANVSGELVELVRQVAYLGFAIGLGLVVAAVFVGRARPESQEGFTVLPPKE